MEEKDKEIALYVIELKIANEIKKGINYNKIKEKVEPLLDEKRAIYNNDESVIKKVIDTYLPEIKGE